MMNQETNFMTINQLANQVAYECLCEYCQDVVRHDIKLQIAKLVKEEIETVEDEKTKRQREVFVPMFKALASYQRKFKSMIEGIWKEGEAIILANLKKMKKAWMTKDKVDEILYPVSIFEKKLADGTTGLYVEIMTAEGPRIVSLYEFDMIFDVENPAIQAWLAKYMPKFSKKLEAVSIDKLRAELSEGIKAGESIRELSKRVNLTYANWNKYRSENIARSETIRASNKAALNVYRQSGVVTKKIWISQLDDRTCFPENIKVITKSGEKNIQNIEKGESVLTHNGWQKVKETMKRKYNGKMIEIKTDDDRRLVCTEDHPIYEMKRGWVKAKDLFYGDKLKSYRNEIIEILNVSNFKFFNSNYFISKSLKFLVSFNIFRNIRMPIISINLKTNIKIWKKKIYTEISSYLNKFFYFIFLNKINIQPFKRFSNNRFNSCFSRVFSIARKRTKPSNVFLRRYDAVSLPAINAGDMDGWPSAFFRAIASIISFFVGIYKNFSTSFTFFINGKFSTTIYATNSIPIRYTFINRKGLSTNRTFFSNPLCLFSTVHRTVFFRDSSSPSIKRFSTLRTDFGFTRFCRFVITSLRTIKRIMAFKNFIFRSKFFTTLITYIHYLYGYINKLINNCQSHIVYSLEVENSHTFYANGILVHNCPSCEELDGKVIGLEENYFSMGDPDEVIERDGRTYTFKNDYEDIDAPPRHSSCRCSCGAMIED